MDYTYVDYFNYYLKQFLNELICTYPDLKRAILANYRPLLENKMDKSDLYAKYYYSKINKVLDRITARDASIFAEPGVLLLEGVDFHLVWNSPQCNETNKTAVWKYLQILMVLGRRLIPDHREILQILSDISEGNLAVPAQVEKTLESKDEEESKEDDSGFGLGNLLNMASALGGGGSGGALGGLGDIAGLLGNLDMGKMMESMSGVINQMASAVPAPANATNQPPSESASADSTAESASAIPETDGATPSVDDNSQPASGSAPGGLFGENSLFGELAKEMTETLNLEGLDEARASAEAGGQQPNIGDVMKKVLSGDNPAKLMNLVGKFTSKLQNEISSGRLNQADLLRQTMGMMASMQPQGGGTSGAGNASAMAAQAEQLLNGNPQLRARMQQAARGSSMKERLQKKLADKNAKK